MSSDYETTITRLLVNLKSGGNDTKREAMAGITEAYFERLMKFAQRKMSDRSKRVIDEEDLLQSVFRQFWKKAKEGAYPDLHNRDELWGLLLRITQHKLIDHTRHATRQKRGGGETDEEFVEGIVSEEPTQDFVDALEINAQHLVESLIDPTLQQVALLTAEGYSTAEIAERLGLLQRSVQRKLAEIRKLWKKHLDD